MPSLRLRMPEDELSLWAGRYSYPGEAEIEKRVAPTARARGYLLRDEFLELCRWKTPRSQPRCAENGEDYFRTLWSVGVRRVPQYTFSLWWEYTCFIREISDRTGLSMRTIDRALWQYSKEQQR